MPLVKNKGVCYVLYYAIKKAVKCNNRLEVLNMCKVLNQVNDVTYKALEKELNKRAMQYNVSVQQNLQGDYVLKTAHEMWILAFDAVVDVRKAEITLYHRSCYFAYSKKCGTTCYPDYHVQYRKIQTVVDVLKYVCRHDAYRYNTHKRGTGTNSVCNSVRVTV